MHRDLMLLPILIALAAPLQALAHEGHGMPGVSHWHASDVLVVLAIAAVAGLALWWRGRK